MQKFLLKAQQAKEELEKLHVYGRFSTRFEKRNPENKFTPPKRP